MLAHMLTLLNERHSYGLDLFLLSIDEGITGYRCACGSCMPAAPAVLYYHCCSLSSLHHATARLMPAAASALKAVE